MSIFSPAEIERRWNAVRQNLHADCVVVPSFWNSYYLSGVPMIQWGRWQITILFRDHEPVLVTPAFEASAAERGSPISDVRLFRDDDGPSSMRTATELAIDALRARSPKTIGVEGRGMPAAMYLQLAEAFPGATLMDASDAVDDARIVSSPEELAYIRIAANAADAGMAAILERMQPGVLEADLCAEAQLAIVRAVPEGVEGHTNAYMQQGSRSAECHGGGWMQPIEAGTFVEVVCECEIWHYQVAVERAILVGEAPEPVERGVATMIEAFQAARDAVRPGTTFAEVDRVARQIFVEAGYDQVTTGAGLVRNITHHTGGRLEYGNFRPGNDRKLEPGMHVTVEPWAVMPGVGGPRHCDPVVVTEHGQELLSRIDSSLLRVGTGAAVA